MQISRYASRPSPHASNTYQEGARRGFGSSNLGFQFGGRRRSAALEVVEGPFSCLGAGNGLRTFDAPCKSSGFQLGDAVFSHVAQPLRLLRSIGASKAQCSSRRQYPVSSPGIIPRPSSRLPRMQLGQQPHQPRALRSASGVQRARHHRPPQYGLLSLAPSLVPGAVKPVVSFQAR